MMRKKTVFSAMRRLLVLIGDRKNTMLSILQNIFIIILTPVSRISGKLNDRVRAICIQIICLYFPLYFIYYYIGMAHPDYIISALSTHNERHLMGCVFLLLLIIFSLDRTPQKVKWSVWIMYPMLICGIWMMVISCLHPVGDGYRAFAMMLVIAFPCLYFVWNNRGDYEHLFDPLARAVCLTGILFFLFSFYLATKGELVVISGRCLGFVRDANLFSMVGMVSVCGALYLLVRDRLSILRFIIYSIVLGMGIAIVLMGQSRTSLAVCIVNILVSLFFYIRYSKKSKPATVILKTICVIGFVVTMVLLSHLCILIEYNVEAQINAAIETEQGVTPAPAVTQTDETSVFDRITYDENTTLDIFTAGRYHIWKSYSRFFNLTGNDYSKINWEDLTQNSVRHAHNNFVEMAYRFGVPLGIFFILFEAIVCLKALQYLFINRQKRIVLLLPILFVVMFFFESMLDIATIPFERDAPFYFYIALVPMVDMNYRFKEK